MIERATCNPLLAMLFLWILTIQGGLAQTFLVSGRITDATTLEPVAFANVYFSGSNTGSTSDFNGYFSIESTSRYDSITVSFIGYQTVRKPIDSDSAQTIDFMLFPMLLSLSEVVILPGENPAIPIMKRAMLRKAGYNHDSLPAYEYSSYVKSQVFLRKLFGRQKAGAGNATGVYAQFSMVADENAPPALPVYTSEVISKVYYHRSPEREKTVVQAVKSNSLAVAETGLLTQLVQKSIHYNFNNNHVKILDKSFISPLSNTGMFYYRYYLMDSVFIDDVFCYEIRVTPKRLQDLAFSGTVWISDSSYALKRVSLEIGPEANLNFVQRIKIQQDYLQGNEGKWYPKSTRILADAINIFISAYIAKDHFIANTSYDLSFYHTELLIPDSVYTLSPSSWDKLRPIPLDENDLLSNRYIDSLKQINQIRFLTGMVNMFVKGYVDIGKLEIGPYLLIYQHNEVEGHKFRLGYRTHSRLSTKWLSKGYLAYGTANRKLSGNFQWEYFISRASWTKIGMQYMDDTERLGAIDEFASKSDFLSFSTTFGGSDKMNRVRMGRLWLASDVFKGYHQHIVLKQKHYQPISPDFFFEYFIDPARAVRASDIRTTEINFTGVYQPKAVFIVDKNERFAVSIKKAPIFTWNYTLGLKDVFSEGSFYHLGSLQLEQTKLLGGFGVMQYQVSIAKAFSPLPYPLLSMFPANESFFRFDRRYNLMRYGEFLADESAELFFTYRQEGFILDKIPFVKRLRLRSVVSLSMAFGSFDARKNGYYHEMANPTGILPAYHSNGNPLTGFRTLDPWKPYAEVSYGIENIFSVFRVDAIHRLSYLDPGTDGLKPSSFGLKLGATFRF